MTDAQKAAIEWLDYVLMGMVGPPSDHLRTLKAMALRPHVDFNALDEARMEPAAPRFRIRAKDLDITHDGPVSISEVPDAQ